MNSIKALSFSLIGLYGLVEANFTENHAWSFQAGNLVSNWSFENETTEICQTEQPGTGGTVTDCHKFLGLSAHRGNYALSVKVKNEGVASTAPWSITQTSRLTPIEPSTSYTFSLNMNVTWSEKIASSAPVVCWMKADKTFIGCSQGLTYLSVFPKNVTNWAPYSFTFTTSADAQYMYFHLAQSNNDGVTGQAGDSYQFDDIIIQKTGNPISIIESRSYANAAGRVDHTIVNDGAKDVVNKKEYDALGRLSRAYLPVTVTGTLSSGEFVASKVNLANELTVDYPTLQDAYTDIAAQVGAKTFASLPTAFSINVIVATALDLAPLSQEALDIEPMTTSDNVKVPIKVVGIIKGSAEFTSLKGRHTGPAAGYVSRGPFTGNLNSLLTSQYPGESNQYSAVTYPNPGVDMLSTTSLPGSLYGTSHRNRSGGGMLVSNTIPTSVENPPNPADVEMPYTYFWSQDPQGKYTAEIRDERGLLVKSAVSDVANPTSELDWIITQYQYDSFGRLTSTLSPTGISTTNGYNGLSQLISKTDPDRGLVDALYDVKGRQRFSRTPTGLSANRFVATQYDAVGRLVGTGLVSSASTNFTQSNADNVNYPGVANLYQGFLYDALEPTLFNTATGTTLASLGYTPPIKNSQGRMVVGYNRNTETVPPGTWSNADRLVATFNSYDSLGRLQDVWKYIGFAPTNRKWHKMKYLYDNTGNLSSFTVFNDQTENQVVAQSKYVYDFRGRVAQILDKDGQSLTKYTYDFLDQTTKVRLPGSIEMAFTYDIQGKPRSLTSTAGSTVIFQEQMGYESMPNTNISPSSLIAPRFDGTVSSLVRKFSSSAANPVEFWKYAYDNSGRMLESNKHLPSSGGGLDGLGGIIYPVTLNTTPIDFRDYNYSDDGSIQSQSTKTQTHVYSYATGTHKLNAIAPNLTGRTTSAGSFIYDADGRLTKDNGTGKTFTYTFTDLPVKQVLSSRTYHYVYDEYNNRVATLDQRGTVVQGRKIYVYESGLKILKEIVYRETAHPDGAINFVKYHEYGKGGLVAVSYGGSSDRQIPVKNYQGSIMAVVNVSNYGVVKEQGYKAYGGIDKRVVPSTDMVVSEAYTGKEFEDASGLYYFGARWFDPELGMWLVPDAAGQFANPYSFGGNPVNGVDADGNWFGIDDAIAIGIGAIGGGVVAVMNGHDPTDAKFWAYVAGGAAIAEASLLTGGAAAGALSSYGAVAAGVGAGAAGGAVGGFGNYALGSGVETGFSNFDVGNAWDATWKGAAAGAIGGGIGGGLTSLGYGGAYAAAGSGFAGGASGAALNGASGKDILLGGLVGGGVGLAAYSAKWGYENYGPGDGSVTKAEGAGRGHELPSRTAGEQERLMMDDFSNFRNEGMKSPEFRNGESLASYKTGTRWLNGRAYANRVWGMHSESTHNGILTKGGNMIVHSHPNNPFPSNVDFGSVRPGVADYMRFDGTGQYYQTYGGNSKLYQPVNY